MVIVVSFASIETFRWQGVQALCQPGVPRKSQIDWGFQRLGKRGSAVELSSRQSIRLLDEVTDRRGDAVAHVTSV
jgi:hypothetical protein